MAYIDAGRRVLGGVPTQTRIIAERFFDEAGGMQLVIHAPFGGRLNRAWGLALRKRFCVNFDFELQAAATDEGLVLSLGEKHSFPLGCHFPILAVSFRAGGADASAPCHTDVFDALAMEYLTLAGALALSKREKGAAASSTYARGGSVGRGVSSGDGLSGQSCG